MSHQVNQSDTLTLYPVSLDTTNSDFPGTYYNNLEIDNAFTNASSSTRAAIYTNTGSRATTTVYLNFDCSEIPIGATINSISCQVKCGTQGTNYFGTRTVQMTTGTTTKGSATTMSGSNSSPTTHTLTVGSWTAAELQNAKLKFYIQRGTSNTTTGATFSIYGATLSVSYTYSETIYDIVASSSVSGVTATPAIQDGIPGGEATVTINGDITDLSITDNGADITNNLVEHQSGGSGSKSTVLGTYTLSSGGFNGSGASYFSGLVGKGVNNTQTTSNYYSSGNGTIAVFTYNLTFNDIPSNATITRLYCQVNGHAESTSQSSEYMCAQLMLGSTAISTELNFKSIGTSNSTQTIEATIIPTLSQLSNLKLQCRLGYYGGAINGATAYVEYTTPSTGSYYTYTVTNIAADHTILIEEAGAYIPPEENPNYTYWPITISSINATTNPANGTTRVIEGTNQIITISPTDPQLTLALDNGVDITSQLVGGVPTNTYTVTTQVSGATYGFELNSNTGYYVSTNNGVNKSASVARLNMDFESSCTVTIQYINYAEANYDYGMFGKLDTTVATDGLTASSNSSSPSDSTNNYQLAMASNSASAQTITYNVPSGQHYIDIKYGKDDASNANNDTLQWKVLSVQATSAGGDYTYTLTNVTQKHSLIFVFGNVSYYFITSNGNSACKLFPDGQSVALQGDNYNLNIVPNASNAAVSITDNGTDRTSQLERLETTKNGTIYVSYKYSLTNIQAAHTLIVQVGTVVTTLYFKNGSSWRAVSKVYKKINGHWVEQVDLTSVFNSSYTYRKG